MFTTASQLPDAGTSGRHRTRYQYVNGSPRDAVIDTSALLPSKGLDVDVELKEYENSTQLRSRTIFFSVGADNVPHTHKWVLFEF